MKLKKQWILQFLIGIVLIVLGIFILIRPDMFKQVFVITLGVVAIITGISSLATMNKYSFGRFNRGSTLVKGILGIIIGVLAVILPLAMAEVAWKVIIYILAAQMAISAVVMLLDAVAVRSAGFSPVYLVVEGLVSLVLAIVLFLAPSSIADILVTVLGVTVIVVGLTFGLLALASKKKGGGITVEATEVHIDET
ncbi:MAG: DUF308 domain-containing protein [Sphaerochaetaceae bacterium]